MKLLMVCLGNICRSPLAEGIMRHLADEQQLGWEISSAGTGDWHVNQPADRRSIAVAKKFGYDISAQRARHFNAKMFDEFDHILVMDRQNLRDVLQLASNDRQRKKVRLFLTDDLEVTDPYYDDNLFEPVFLGIEERCKQLIKEIK
ncbi:low molecular weight protein-tyrosine-phosphatase [Pedobacter heparinus]|uniref:protein-tyrosine-phosphatase n=1 Tax=Pedobacter heparinus (strain ATCC 13125 / DSM 2366 / CIP 104194 / JCM 7457 / NBRC 12017 / NCIMB 9290 / NRRL B-14731 / HIM 762-3) TaxID=485917 RepID=C6XYC2_PEDHD|nr:low molecular weight protein-tyrosine-phosphatase [Pedobacter heparinus]ACU02389.1 Protein-tyrosine phosphatase, low molecular weight [Pedobacter heparinus DSM 2366]